MIQQLTHILPAHLHTTYATRSTRTEIQPQLQLTATSSTAQTLIYVYKETRARTHHMVIGQFCRFSNDHTFCCTLKQCQAAFTLIQVPVGVTVSEL